MKTRLRYTRRGWFRLGYSGFDHLVLGPFPSAEAAVFLQGFAVVA